MTFIASIGKHTMLILFYLFIYVFLFGGLRQDPEYKWESYTVVGVEFSLEFRIDRIIDIDFTFVCIFDMCVSFEMGKGLKCLLHFRATEYLPNRMCDLGVYFSKNINLLDSAYDLQ